MIETPLREFPWQPVVRLRNKRSFDCVQLCLTALRMTDVVDERGNTPEFGDPVKLCLPDLFGQNK